MMRYYNFHRDTASKLHEEVNQKYDKTLPYVHHLDMVVYVCRQFKHLIPQNEYFDVETGCYFHGAIEDARVTYNDIMDMTNSEKVAEYVYAVTNEKGKNRFERANAKYYEGIRNLPYATYIKLCDRIANMQYSKNNGSSMHKKYVLEYSHFKYSLYDETYKEMFEYIENNLL